MVHEGADARWIRFIVVLLQTLRESAPGVAHRIATVSCDRNFGHKTTRRARARELCYTGDVNAEEALRIGLMNAVVPHADLMTKARETADLPGENWTA